MKQRNRTTRIVFSLVAASMIVLSALSRHWLYCGLGILVLVACFYQREHIVSEEGVDIQSTLFGITTHDLWTWDEITTLHVDHEKARPDVMLHIGKDIVTRTFVFPSDEYKEVVRFFRKQNPSLYIQEM